MFTIFLLTMRNAFLYQAEIQSASQYTDALSCKTNISHLVFLKLQSTSKKDDKHAVWCEFVLAFFSKICHLWNCIMLSKSFNLWLNHLISPKMVLMTVFTSNNCSENQSIQQNEYVVGSANPLKLIIRAIIKTTSRMRF